MVPNPYTMETYRDTEAIDLADHISRFVNSYGDGKLVAQKMSQDHPTLQQGMMRFFMHFVDAMANQRYADARNQGSVDLAKKILELPRNLPLI